MSKISKAIEAAGFALTLALSPVHRQLVAQGAELERWRVKIMALGLTEEQATQLVNDCLSAATLTTESNMSFAKDALDRVYAMIARGDAFEQVSQWCGALPGELMAQRYQVRGSDVRR